MLQYEYTNLDDEFVHLWSQYKIHKESNKIMPQLKDLALRGQINAVQKWYLFNNAGVCHEIDNIAESYKGTNYEELWAIAIYKQSQLSNIKKLDEKVKRFNFLYEKYITLIDNHGDEKQIDEIEKSMHQVEIEINQKTYLNYYREAFTEALKQAKETKNIYIFARVCEMIKKYNNELPIKAPFVRQSIKLHAKAKAINKEVVENLYSKYKQFKANGINPYQHPQFYFHFANACTLFKSNKLFNKNSKYATIAKEIYSNIASEKVKQENEFLSE